MARRCSHCNHDGHNSRTCPNRGVRLFGVRLTDGSFQKSASTGNLAFFARSAAAGGSPHVDPQDASPAYACGSGYASDGSNLGPASRERKKGVPWTEHEHKMFLVGLKKLGKGDWRGIARSYVISRTPTQVASHAQKYFIRHSTNNRRKKRVSLFDIVTDETTPAENLPSSSQEQEMQDSSLQTVIQISEKQVDMKTDSGVHETMKYAYPPPIYPVLFPIHQVSDENVNIKFNSTPEVEGAAPESPATMQYSYLPIYPGFLPPGFTCPMPYWPGYAQPAVVSQSHEIIKPLAVYSKCPIKVDEPFGMSRLSLGACNGEAGPLMLKQKVVGGSQRQSAFHSGASAGGSRLNSSSSPIHAT